MAQHTEAQIPAAVRITAAAVAVPAVRKTNGYKTKKKIEKGIRRPAANYSVI